MANHKCVKTLSKNIIIVRFTNIAVVTVYHSYIAENENMTMIMVLHDLINCNGLEIQTLITNVNNDDKKEDLFHTNKAIFMTW